jgi:hypothetical protein
MMAIGGTIRWLKQCRLPTGAAWPLPPDIPEVYVLC